MPLLLMVKPGTGTTCQSQDRIWQRQLGQDSLVPIAMRPHVLDQARSLGWQTLLRSAELRDELRHHCLLCGQWCSTGAGVKIHLSANHPEWRES